MLTRLSNDPAIRHVMQKHKLSVGVLTELAPHEHPELLGLNENAGQVIKLRLRTNAYDGFRLYSNIRMVLCHELTHNIWRDHDDNVCSPSRCFAAWRANLTIPDIDSSRSSTPNLIKRLSSSTVPLAKGHTVYWAVPTYMSPPSCKQRRIHIY